MAFQWGFPLFTYGCEGLSSRYRFSFRVGIDRFSVMKKWFSAYCLIFSRYMDYRGRSPRRELWNFVINTLLIEVIFYITTGRAVIVGIFHIVAVIVMMALVVRRFHDIGYSGWFTLTLFIPIVNIGAFIVLLFFKSTPGANRFGPLPS